jgi:hypothetical protein
MKKKLGCAIHDIPATNKPNITLNLRLKGKVVEDPHDSEKDNLSR